MPKKTSLKYVCNLCGAVFGSWSGRCSSCSEWNSLEEQIDSAGVLASKKANTLKAESISNYTKSETVKRLVSGIGEIDMVLGGGFVPGSVTLLAGEPGIGKSTVLLQIAYKVASSSKKVLYVSGEESTHQVSLRADRLKTLDPNLYVVSSNSANDIAATILSNNYDLVIVDSIQTVTLNEISSSAGSVSQITNCTQLLTTAAKTANSALILVGHVTKEGSIAGPKVLEHTVDTVLQLEGDRYDGFKILRSIKNRFGSTGETGIFEMTQSGLRAVLNPSAALLAERQVSDGSIVIATLEGSRVILVEIQALVNNTSYGYPKRTASGFDLNRLNLLIAVLERRTKLNLSDKDVYINVVGGIKITEPAADLAVAMAVASAAKGMQLKQDAVVFGEIGLSGELRHVNYIQKRLNEARKLGFNVAIGPNSKSVKPTADYSVVTSVKDALNKFLSKE